MSELSTRDSAKTPRAQLMRLDIEADICPQALLRILGYIAQIDLVPLSITADRLGDGQRFRIEIDPLPEDRAATLLAKIGNVVSVRDAALNQLQGET